MTELCWGYLKHIKLSVLLCGWSVTNQMRACCIVNQSLLDSHCCLLLTYSDSLFAGADIWLAVCCTHAPSTCYIRWNLVVLENDDGTGVHCSVCVCLCVVCICVRLIHISLLWDVFADRWTKIINTSICAVCCKQRCCCCCRWYSRQQWKAVYGAIIWGSEG